MASAEESLVAILKGDATVAGLVGNRIFPKILPQNVIYPAVRYQRISTARDQFRVLSRSGGKATRQQSRIQVDSWALTEAVAQQVGAAVRGALDGFAGTSAALQIDQLWIEDEGGDTEENVEGGAGEGGAHLYRVRQDYLISHGE